MQALLHAIAQLPLPTEAGRHFHGRGGLYPGSEAWTLDAYPPVWVVTAHAPVSDADRDAVGQALTARWAELSPGQPLNWVFQLRPARAAGQGATAETRLMAGAVPEPHVVQEGDARHVVHVLKGQNHGLFLDMAEGRRWLRAHVQGLVAAGRNSASADGTTATPRPVRVLNLFAYTCGFSVAARLGGASRVVNVDMSRSALAVGQHNHALNAVQTGVSFLAHDVFSSMGAIRRSGPYDVVVVDPPSHQKGSFVATKDYARVLRHLDEWLVPGGHALLALNAPELDSHFLLDAVAAHAPQLAFQQRLPNPAAFADGSPERALKVLVFQHTG